MDRLLRRRPFQPGASGRDFALSLISNLRLSASATVTVFGAAEAADPEYDQAGPARVKALVLVKAPAWPLGPGDVEAGLASAQRAVALRPQYPPNVLALAEALAKSGDTHGAEDAYRHAADLSQALPPSRDREDWLREADQALGRSPPSR